jgi:hypothetical protein
MPETVDRFALVLLDTALPPTGGEVYGEIARLLGRVRYDVIGGFKRSPGVPFEDLDTDGAQAAVRALADAGVRAVAVPAAQLPALPRVLTVHNTALLNDGLSIQTDYAGTRQEVPWEQLAALSAATFTETVGGGGGTAGPSVGGQVAGAAMRAAAGLCVGLPRFGARPMRKPKDPPPRIVSYQVLAVSLLGVPLEIRFRQDTLSYEFLGEFKTLHAAENLRILAGELMARAAHARKSEAFVVLVNAGQPAPRMAASEFLRHNRWLKLLATAGLE